MVSPAIDMLSVFITPWMKPTSCQRATSDALARDHGVEQRAIRVPGAGGVRIVPRRYIVGEQLHRFAVAALGEELEGADTDMAAGDAGEDRARLRPVLAQDLFARGDGGERARGGNAERGHRFADDELAQDGPKRRAPVAATRERRRTRALELDVAAGAVVAAHFAQKDRAPVAQLRHPVAELVARIGHGQRLGTLRHAIAREDCDAAGCREFVGIDARARARDVR